MNKNEFLKRLENEVIVIDGAMGTMLQQCGFINVCLEELNIKNADAVKKIHKAYADAGADLLITNTFGANRLKLSKYGLKDKVVEINKAGLKNAREVCPNCLILGNVGPLGEFIEPLGKLTFDETYEIYKEQIAALQEADILLLHTLSDIKELKSALIAAKEIFNGPIISSMTIQGGRTSTGTDTETYVAIADSLGADIIGVNCSDGPDGMYETAKVIVKNTNKPICLEPNAGMPKIVNNKTIWDYPIERFVDYAEKFVKLGANIVGGCCGTNPDFIKAVANRVKGLKPIKREIKEETKLCSRTKTITIKPTLIVGERINPTNRKGFIEEIKQGKTDYIRNQALQQIEEGASLLDINLGVAGVDETKTLPKAIEVMQNVVNVPLVIDTSNVKALEEALKKCDGKALINSVNGSENSLKTVLPLAKKYGSAIIALCLDDLGIPKTKDKRIEIAKKIIKEAEGIGVKREDIIVDALVLTIATNPENEKIILDTINEVKKLGYKTILGISNISHGLPNRSEINSRFLTKAKKAGLDLAILNPIDNIMQTDTSIEIKVKRMKEGDYKGLPIDKQLYNAILYGDKDNIIGIIEKSLEGLNALKINDILIDALNEVGDKFNKKEYFLPQVLLSAEAMKRAFTRLKKELSKESGKERGIVLFATVENDIHDIGKNIVIALLESHNYKVIDLGVNIKTTKIVEEVEKYKPDIVALSALMTTTVLEMENVIKGLRRECINVPVVVGGAVVTDDYASQIKAAYGKDALAAVKKINELITRKSENKETKKITAILKEKKFTISVELVPPRNGEGKEGMLSKIRMLKGKVDFVSITKGAGGSLRGGTLPISVFAKDLGITPISHFVCRERTKAEIENDLIDMYYFNINNILALRGDPPAGAKDEEWDGDYEYAYLLVKQIGSLNKGRYLPRKNIDNENFRQDVKTDFCIIVAGHPEDPIEEELKHIKAKVDSGAEVIITQMIFSFEEYKKYAEDLRRNGVRLPIIQGIRPLTSFKQVESVENFFKLKVCDKLKYGLQSAKTDKEAYEFGVNYTSDIIKRLKEYGAPGVHLFVLNDIDIVEEILRRIS